MTARARWVHLDASTTTVRERIYALDDESLVVALAWLRRGPEEVVHLTAWAAGFADDLLEQWREHGQLSWRQRRCARQIVQREAERLDRSARLTERLSGRRSAAESRGEGSESAG